MLFLWSCGSANTDDRQSAELTQDTSITLTPKTSTYDLNKVSQGIINFSALIKNTGTETITIAHPSVCFPDEYLLGEVRNVTDSHGKSEILLKITKSDGDIVVLRDGYHGFDPGNIHHIVIPPGEAKSFHVGWFFQNARGRWENNRDAWEVFLQKGTYKVSILFRNTFPKAAIFNKTDSKTRFVDVWTGELQSEEVTVEIK